MFFGMFDNKNRAGMQQAGMQDFYRDFLKSRKVVRGIGKHYIISCMRTLYETEHITTDKRMFVFRTQLFGNLADEISLRGGLLH